MQPKQKLDFLNKFFDFTNPIPHQTAFTQEDLKNNDMKISLEIATRSNLRMQSDPKTSLVSFSCKNFGKHCYEIFAFRKDNQYFVEANYCKVRHRRNCELRNQAFEYLKIYNLMKLKKNLIQDIMVKLNLFTSSPSQILAKISNAQQYFFEENINYNPEMRRKLRKRFDNIINIDIKKITKGGREEVFGQAKGNRQAQTLKEKVKVENLVKIEESESEFDETSFFQKQKKMNKKKKPKISKNKPKNKNKKPKPKSIPHSFHNKQNLYLLPPSQTLLKKPKLQQQIYCNPASACQLKQIKELNQQFNGFEDIFAWSFQEPSQHVETETINDKLRDGVLWSLRNSLVRKLEGQSLEDMRFLQEVGYEDVEDEAVVGEMG